MKMKEREALESADNPESVEALQKRIHDLENELHRSWFANAEIGAMFGMIGLTILFALGVPLIAFLWGKENPYKGAFGFLTFGLVGALLVVYLIMFSLGLNRRLHIKAELSATKAKLEAKTN